MDLEMIKEQIKKIIYKCNEMINQGNEAISLWLEKRSGYSYISKYEKVMPKVLIARSMDVQNLFINEIIIDEKTGEYRLSHHLPYDKDYDKDMVERNIEKLKEYAEIIIYLMQHFGYKTVRETIKDPNHFLPPWYIFPMYDSYTDMWSSGIAEEYIGCYLTFLNQLPQIEKEQYRRTYPVPSYLEEDIFLQEK